MAIEGDKARVTKQQWRTVVISIAAMAFSATAGLEPPLRNLISFGQGGGEFQRQAALQQRADGWNGSRPGAQGRPGRRPGDDPHPDQTKRWTR
ncbi:beta-lactamase family protein [Synechococcus sp. M16.1]|nr:beta-lactamase family protein [Synechococcus sp. M16.1]